MQYSHQTSSNVYGQYFLLDFQISFLLLNTTQIYTSGLIWKESFIRRVTRVNRNVWEMRNLCRIHSFNGFIDFWHQFCQDLEAFHINTSDRNHRIILSDKFCQYQAFQGLYQILIPTFSQTDTLTDSMRLISSVQFRISYNFHFIGKDITSNRQIL